MKTFPEILVNSCSIISKIMNNKCNNGKMLSLLQKNPHKMRKTDYRKCNKRKENNQDLENILCQF